MVFLLYIKLAKHLKLIMVNRRSIRFLPAVFHFSIAGCDIALMVHYRGLLPNCPDLLRGWVYGQFIIHFWAGLVSANRALQTRFPPRDLGEALCSVFSFVWLIYALVIGYQTKECADSYPVLYSMVVMGAGFLGFKTSRDCKAQASSQSSPLLSVVVVPRPVPYQTVNDNALNENCSFCMEEFESNDMVVLLLCNHVYHPRVIRAWLSTSQTCPLCRKSVEVR